MCNRYALAYVSITLYTTVTVIILILITHKKSLFTFNISEEDIHNATQQQNISVEVWGKASISIYLWEHVLEGKLTVIENGMGKIGKRHVNNLVLNFKYGPIFIQTTVPKDVEYLVLVLNGHSDEKIKVAKGWLDYIPRYLKLKKLIVVLLGSEDCVNDWILPYMNSRGGKVNAVFVIYDSLLVDNIEFFQWPLGVAEYRGFKNVHPKDTDVFARRSFVCNFLGTVYSNSSRSLLVDVVNSLQVDKKCPVIGRKMWVPTESKESLERYITTLADSDLTLCPVGLNAECYRIYEAVSYGSVPVVEDHTTSGACDKNAFRLLKQYNAPFLFIRDWEQLSGIIRTELNMPQRLKRLRRKSVLKWYSDFKNQMKYRFIQIASKIFSS